MFVVNGEFTGGYTGILKSGTGYGYVQRMVGQERLCNSAVASWFDEVMRGWNRLRIEDGMSMVGCTKFDGKPWPV